MSVAIPEVSVKRRRLRVERLPAVTDEELTHPPHLVLNPPHWLRRVERQRVHKTVHCLRPRTRMLKRTLDIVLASVLIVVTMPLMLIAALVIKISSPGPVIFTQFRAGLFGVPFRIYKLRTMRSDADGLGPVQAKQGDARVTPFGRFLRQMRIDELPQLFNVLLGDMSLVGPRPECIEYMEELAIKVPDYPQRLGLKPGLTGIAQIESGYANDLDSYRRKVAYDLLYLKNCCVRNDLKILLRTVKVVLTGFGAL